MNRGTDTREIRFTSNGRHMSYLAFSRHVFRATAVLSLAFTACNDSFGDPTLDSGPPGGRVKFDPSEIDGAGSAGANSAGVGGSTSTGGNAATGGSTVNGGVTGGGGAAVSGGTTSQGGKGGSNVGTGTSLLGTLGNVCELDSDCKSPLVCNYDSTNYIAHKQCVLPCKTNGECESAFGADAFCLGAGICVRACLLDSECPPLTQCFEAGWCKRSGPGSGIPRCTGSATPCSLLSATSCLSTVGCTDASYCGGVSSSCYSMYSSYSCNDQPGCYWSSYSKDCSGSASYCSSQRSRYSCTDVDGCSWRAACSGMPYSCESLTQATCLSQQGCRLEIE
jgi:hypothetical protein